MPAASTYATFRDDRYGTMPWSVCHNTPSDITISRVLEMTTATLTGIASGPVVATRMSGETSAYAPIARSA